MIHEPAEHGERVVGPSNRSFGLVFAALFALVALGPLWRGDAPRTWPAVVSGLFLVAALGAPAVLAPLNNLWLRLGLAMHRVVNPIVMRVLFYGAMMPFGLVMRALGKGLAPRLRPDASMRTYWVPRGAEDRTRMDQQF